MRYEFGIIFDFYPLLKRNDPTSIFDNNGHERLLQELIKYIVTEPSGYVGEVEELLSSLIEEDVLQYPVVLRNREPYIDIPHLLVNLCEDLVDLLRDTGFFDHCRSFDADKPKVQQISRETYAIVVGPTMRI